jgi:hypothetical protein
MRATQAPSHEASETDQQLLAVAISAALIRTQLDQPLCADERARLADDLEQVEMIRRALEQQHAALRRPRFGWWGLFRV